MNDVTIPHALCIEKNIVYNVISFREGWYGFRNPQCGDPEHRITFCEINSIKTDNIGGYIIKDVYRSHFGKCAWFPISRISTKILLYIQIKHLKYSYLRNTHYLILFNHIFSENLKPRKKNYRICVVKTTANMFDWCSIWPFYPNFYGLKPSFFFFHFNESYLRNKIS